MLAFVQWQCRTVALLRCPRELLRWLDAGEAVGVGSKGWLETTDKGETRSSVVRPIVDLKSLAANCVVALGRAQVGSGVDVVVRALVAWV